MAQNRGLHQPFRKWTSQGQRSCAGTSRLEVQRLAAAAGVLACYSLLRANRVRTLWLAVSARALMLPGSGK